MFQVQHRLWQGIRVADACKEFRMYWNPGKSKGDDPVRPADRLPGRIEQSTEFKQPADLPGNILAEQFVGLGIHNFDLHDQIAAARQLLGQMHKVRNVTCHLRELPVAHFFLKRRMNRINVCLAGLYDVQTPDARETVYDAQHLNRVRSGIQQGHTKATPNVSSGIALQGSRVRVVAWVKDGN